MEKLELLSSWKWTPNSMVCSIQSLTGGMIPDEVRQQLNNLSLKLKNDTKCWALGEKMSRYLYNDLPKPEPLELGTKNVINGVTGEISVIETNSSKARMLYWTKYNNGHKQRVWHEWEVSQLPTVVKTLISEIDSEANDRMREHFLATYGNGLIDPEKWKAEKTKIFVSYRGDYRKVAEQLVKGLGEYGNQSFFLPQVDFLDMQAGNWLDQLMEMISDCMVFIPILSKDYLDGPISKPELDVALRGHYQNNSKRVIPLLIEGEPEDYSGHFIGGFHMVQAQDGIDDKKLEEIAYLSLELSKNPYK